MSTDQSPSPEFADSPPGAGDPGHPVDGAGETAADERPEAEETSGPREWRPVAPGEHRARTPLPPAVKWGGLGILALLLVGAVLAGIAMGGGFAPADSPSPTPTPALAMEPPVQVGDFVRGELTESQGPAPAQQRIVRADYSDGAAKLVLLLTFPEHDVADFLLAAGIERPEAGEVVGLDGVACGVSADTTRPACGKVVDNTGLLVVSLTDTGEAEVRELLSEFETSLTP